MPMAYKIALWRVFCKRFLEFRKKICKKEKAAIYYRQMFRFYNNTREEAVRCIRKQQMPLRNWKI